MDSQTPLALAESADPSGEPAGREPWLRFALIFGVLAVASEAIYYSVVLDSEIFHGYLEVLTKISGAFLGLFDGDVSTSGRRITNSAFSVEVAQGCDAIQVCSLLAAAVIAFPVGFKRKLRGLVWGVALLQILNLLRIITLFWVGVYFSSVFHTAHTLVWPGILITVTIVVWILWVRVVTRAEEPPSEHAA